jgi:hypothetical protein
MVIMAVPSITAPMMAAMAVQPVFALEKAPAIFRTSPAPMKVPTTATAVGKVADGGVGDGVADLADEHCGACKPGAQLRDVRHGVREVEAHYREKEVPSKIADAETELCSQAQPPGSLSTKIPAAAPGGIFAAKPAQPCR